MDIFKLEKYKKDSYRGDKDSIQCLIKYYKKTQNKKKLKEFCRLGMAHKDPFSVNELGIYYYRKGSLNKAKNLFLVSLRYGGEKTATNLGLYYTYGCYKPDKAIMYYKIGVDAGDPVAMFRLGLAYGSCGENKLSEKYLLLAMENGHIDSIYFLARHYDYVDNNLTKACKYYSMGIDKKIGKCLYNICQLYLDRHNYEKMVEPINSWLKHSALFIDRLRLPSLLTYWLYIIIKNDKLRYEDSLMSFLNVKLFKKKIEKQSSIRTCEQCTNKKSCIPYGRKDYLCMKCYVKTVMTRDTGDAIKTSFRALVRKNENITKRISHINTNF